MTLLSTERHCAELEAHTAAMAELVGAADPELPVPACPEWTLAQLVQHVGRGQRWAAEIIARRATERVPFEEVPAARMPERPHQRPAWLRDGAATLVATARGAGPAPVWSFAGPREPGFWARRWASETAVHHVDAGQALGVEVELAPDVAADALDEWLSLLTMLPSARAVLKGDGETLRFHAADGGRDGEWLARRGPRGVEVERRHARADVAVRGPASEVLLVLMRRRTPSGARIEVLGEASLLAHWLEHTRF